MTIQLSHLNDAERLIAIGNELERTATELRRECIEGKHIDLAQTYGHIECLHSARKQVAALASDLIATARGEVCSHK